MTLQEYKDVLAAGVNELNGVQSREGIFDEYTHLVAFVHTYRHTHL